MLLMGDEVRRTQWGNNNAYCQDNETSWFDWRNLDEHADLLRFVRNMIAFTQARAIFREERFWNLSQDGLPPIITWHGVALNEPDWGDTSHSLAFELYYPKCGDHLHVILNAYWKALTFALPPLQRGVHWWRIVDTALPSPDDFCMPETAPLVETPHYRAEARSSVVLLAQ